MLHSCYSQYHSTVNQIFNSISPPLFFGGGGKNTNFVSQSGGEPDCATKLHAKILNIFKKLFSVLLNQCFSLCVSVWGWEGGGGVSWLRREDNHCINVTDRV